MIDYPAEIKYWVQEHIDLIEEHKFQELYSCANVPDSPVTPSILTDLLYEAGCKPEPYLRFIPQKFMNGTKQDIAHYVFPKQITMIGPNAFRLTNIEEAIIPEGCLNIKNNAFSSCPNLHRVVLPVSLERLGTMLFNGCPSLKSIEYKGTIEQFKNITKPVDWCKTAWNTNPIPVICLDGEVMSDVS